MKIIKPGRNQKGWAHEFTCTGAGNGNGGCGAILLVEQADLYQTSSSYMNETDYYVTFKCISCRVETDVDQVFIPSHIKDCLPKRPRPSRNTESL